MSCFLAMLMVCGASCRACRTVDAPGQTIAGVVWQIARGAIRERQGASRRLWNPEKEPAASALPLTGSVDGRPIHSVGGYLLAAIRVIGYIADLWDNGSVELWRADRHYTIRDGLVEVSVNRTVFERVARRSIPIRVSVTITARETSAGTRFSATALGTKRGCLGGRLISRGLSAALDEIESAGRGLYGSGADPGQLADLVIAKFAMR